MYLNSQSNQKTLENSPTNGSPIVNVAITKIQKPRIITNQNSVSTLNMGTSSSQMETNEKGSNEELTIQGNSK